MAKRSIALALAWALSLGACGLQACAWLQPEVIRIRDCRLTAEEFAVVTATVPCGDLSERECRLFNSLRQCRKAVELLTLD